MINGLPATKVGDKYRRAVLDRFGGYNHTDACRDGELWDMKNLSSDWYPKLGVRSARGLVRNTGKSITAMTVRDGVLYYTADENGVGVLYRMALPGGDPAAVSGLVLTAGRKNLCWIQEELVLFPDGCFYRPASGGRAEVFGVLSEEKDTWKALGFFAPDEERQIHYYRYQSYGSYMKPGSDTKLESPYFLVRLSDKMEAVPEDLSDYPYAHLVAETADGEKAVILSDNRNQEVLSLASRSIAWVKDTGEVPLVEGSGTGFLALILKWDRTEAIDASALDATVKKVSLTALMPKLEIAFECGNRIWGTCGNTVYASGIGEPGEFTETGSLSTSPWWCRVGSAGGFTAGMAYEGVPTFFKENLILRVYGSTPSKFYTVESVNLGVEAGSRASCAVVQGNLIYHSRRGICSYAGGDPNMISSAWGNDRYCGAVAGSDGVKYYVSLCGESGGWRLFVFDSQRGTWHAEDALHAAAMTYDEGRLYIADASGRIWAVGNREGLPEAWSEETEIKSSAEFGDFVMGTTNRKSLRRLRLRLELEAGASVTVSLSHDGGAYEVCGSVAPPAEADGTSCVNMPLLPRRCDRFRIRLDGVGRWRLAALTQEYRTGSDER